MSITLSVLESLTEALVHELDRSAPRSTRDSCCEFVVGFYEGMQLIYRIAFMVLSAWFALSSLVACRKTFSTLTMEERSRRAEQWRNSSLPIKKDFIKVIFTLAVLSYYDDEAVTDALGIERAAYLSVLSFYNGSASDD